MFHAKMGMIKDRKPKAITEAEDTRREGKNTQNDTKKVLISRIIMMVWSLT